jgi:hypothetical protein
LHDYLVYDDNFKPIVISFDELGASKYSLVLLKWQKYGFKAVFFCVMTVSVNRPNYLSKEQPRLAEQGHVSNILRLYHM